MAERKKKPAVAKGKKPGIRLMTPYSMQCTHCGEFIPKGRKFNAGKDITEERYMSVRIIRFLIKCTRCSGLITFKTDPKNGDYAVESGAKRNFEAWRDETDSRYHETEEQTLDRLEQEHLEQEEQADRDKMADLEEKMLDSKREMAIADALDDIRTRNARIERNEARGEDSALATAAQKKLDEEGAREAAKQAWIEEGVEEARQTWRAMQNKPRVELEQEEVLPEPVKKLNSFQEFLANGCREKAEREANERAELLKRPHGALLLGRREARLAARKEQIRQEKKAARELAAKQKQQTDQAEQPADKPTDQSAKKPN
ncbi:hypothetical protein N7457_001858 [Penicillium paradoxum]|uniref:uncharacterized protein n=1 Tax=Penicillium paradoxum TaxID=176176 RepID=UPI002547B461|nr:uncharacterized protein N7457_001858 [Penicillium paradoxum]KAJ5795259.1 hypothetical protein N7457_001858 [Penicillium paradoxum]